MHTCCVAFSRGSKRILKVEWVKLLVWHTERDLGFETDSGALLAWQYLLEGGSFEASLRKSSDLG